MGMNKDIEDAMVRLEFFIDSLCEYSQEDMEFGTQQVSIAWEKLRKLIKEKLDEVK